MSLYTKTGFSKPFSCCGHWQLCNMGKLDCHYKDTDPESMENCRCYQKHHMNESDKTFINTISFIEDPQQEPVENLSEKADLEQLSLF